MNLSDLIYLTKHKTETSEFNKGYYVDVLEQLERLEQIKQVWNNEEWCQGIPCNADGLKSLFNYNLDLFNKNLTLDKRVLDLEKELQQKNNAILSLKKENEELKDKLSGIEFWQERYIEHNEELKKVIEILQCFNFKLDHLPNGEYCIYIYHSGIEIRIILTKEEYGLLKEVLGE